MRLILKNLTALLALIGGASTSFAQNYDAAHQVRVGAFAQFVAFRGDAHQVLPAPAQTATLSFSSIAVGATAGIEFVRPTSWSYGVEIDGAVHSGDTNVLGVDYGANFTTSLRLRAGRHIRPDIYWYGTAGVSAFSAEARFVAAGARVNGTKPGYVVGTGLEYDFGPGLWFAEYLYSDYRTFTATSGVNQFAYEADSHSLRLGVKFKVGHDHYRDDVLERIGRRH